MYFLCLCTSMFLNVHIGFSRDVRGLRHYIINKLEMHNETWPPACPPLETARLEHNVLHTFQLIKKRVYVLICTWNFKGLDVIFCK